MDIILRNLLRLISEDADVQQETVEPMSEWKWNKLYRMACDYGIEAWLAEGAQRHADDFFFQPSTALRQKMLAPQSEKDAEKMERFHLYVFRSASVLNRYSRRSLKVYATDLIDAIKNIEE